MTFGASLALFALVWGLFCAVASAVVVDSLLKAVPRPSGPGDTAGLAGHRRLSPLVLTGSAPPRPGDRCFQDCVTPTRNDSHAPEPSADAA